MPERINIASRELQVDDSGAAPEPVRWSLITVTFNSSAALRRFWSDVTLPSSVEWIVVDNNSLDDTVLVAKELGAKVLPLTENIGFGAANNIGFAHSNSTFVAFLNPDVTPVIADLPRLQRVLEQHPDALIAPQLVNVDDSLQANGRNDPYLIYKVLNRLLPESHALAYRMYAEHGEIRRVSWLMGAAVLGTRERLREIGVWDPRFFIYYEDKDICLRNRDAGGEVLLVGDCRWVHGWGRETASLNATAWRHELRSMKRFYSIYPQYLNPFVPGIFGPGRDRGTRTGTR